MNPQMFYAGVGVDGDTHKMYVAKPGHDYRPRVTEVIRSGLQMDQASCSSAEGQYIQGGCGGSIPLRNSQAGSEPARQQAKLGGERHRSSATGFYPPLPGNGMQSGIRQILCTKL